MGIMYMHLTASTSNSFTLRSLLFSSFRFRNRENRLCLSNFKHARAFPNLLPDQVFVSALHSVFTNERDVQSTIHAARLTTETVGENFYDEWTQIIHLHTYFLLGLNICEPCCSVILSNRSRKV